MFPSLKDFPSRAAYEAWSGLYGGTIMEGNASFGDAFLAEHVAGGWVQTGQGASPVRADGTPLVRAVDGSPYGGDDDLAWSHPGMPELLGWMLTVFPDLWEQHERRMDSLVGGPEVPESPDGLPRLCAKDVEEAREASRELTAMRDSLAASADRTRREIDSVERTLEAVRCFVRAEGGHAVFLRRSGRPETIQVWTDAGERTALVEAWKRPPRRPVQPLVYGVQTHPERTLGADFAEESAAIEAAEAYVLRGEPPRGQPLALPPALR